MREQLDILLDELKRLKKEGVNSLLLENDTLDLLEEKLKVQTPVAAKEELSATIPELQQSTQSSTLRPKVIVKENPQPKKTEDFHTIPNVLLPEGNKQEQWNSLKDKVLQCPVCNNHVKAGKQVVFGVGNLDAEIFFCGEAPGADEEKTGEPFVGPAGQLLSKIIQVMGLSREKVYIGNIMNWRPETDSPYGNRPPTQEEMAFCLPYLRAQIQIVKPKVIVALGATAVHGLLGYDAKRSITRCHGQWHDFEATPTIISYHPSYVLRNGTKKVKRQIWEDMLAVMEKLSHTISDKQRSFFQ